MDVRCTDMEHAEIRTRCVCAWKAEAELETMPTHTEGQIRSEERREELGEI